MMMKTFRIAFFLLALLTLITGGCATQPPVKAQADFNVTFTLKTTFSNGKMAFLGVGGEIDGLLNPDLSVQRSDSVRIVLVNDDGMPHDFAIPDLKAQTSMVSAKGQTTDIIIEISTAGEYIYYCTVSGHRQAGMEGKLIVH